MVWIDGVFFSFSLFQIHYKPTHLQPYLNDSYFLYYQKIRGSISIVCVFNSNPYVALSFHQAEYYRNVKRKTQRECKRLWDWEQLSKSFVSGFLLTMFDQWRNGIGMNTKILGLNVILLKFIIILRSPINFCKQSGLFFRQHNNNSIHVSWQPFKVNYYYICLKRFETSHNSFLRYFFR